MASHIAHGIGAARAYVYGDASTVALAQALGGEVILSLAGKYGAHVEIQIEDSVVVVERFDEPQPPERRRSAVYVYVPDAVAAFAAAVEGGAAAVSAPDVKAYGERVGELRDGFGNTWYVATYLGAPSQN